LIVTTAIIGAAGVTLIIATTAALGLTAIITTVLYGGNLFRRKHTIPVRIDTDGNLHATVWTGSILTRTEWLFDADFNTILGWIVTAFTAIITIIIVIVTSIVIIVTGIIVIITSIIITWRKLIGIFIANWQVRTVSRFITRIGATIRTVG
jgi:hypothetical protein